MKFTVYDKFSTLAGAKMASRARKAEHIVAQQAKDDTSPYVPFLTGSLDIRTRVIGNTIIYPGPYARYLYHGVKMVNAATGKGPGVYTDKFGNEFIRYRKGTKLRPTTIPLKYTTQHHLQAGPNWFERSKAQNMDKWERVAAGALING